MESLPIRCSTTLSDYAGNLIKAKTSIVYLGACIDASGNIQSELNRRIGMATADFKVLSRIWSHANIKKKRKYQIYLSCIVSKLLYGLQTAWLTKIQRRKLDGFHARCLRRIAGIKHPFFSRVSNNDVLAIMEARPLSIMLLEFQLKYFKNNK